MMPSSARPASELPAVDERLVAPESGYEIIDGRVVAVPPAREPHAERHAKLGALLEAAVVDDYNVAIDMLTRTSQYSDIAPDASVYPIARDPSTGGRQLEELAFEIASTQSLTDAGRKAQLLTQRGVRRVFALDLDHGRVLEWSRETSTWEILPDSGTIEDRVFATPIPVAALIKAAKVDDAVARALLAKQNPVLVTAIAEGRTEERRQLLRTVLERRFGPLAPEHVATLQQAGYSILGRLLDRALAADTLSAVFDR